MKKVISTDKAPAAIGPYSQGIDGGGAGSCGDCPGSAGENSARMSSSAKLPSAGVPDPSSHWVSISGSDWVSI